MKCLKCGKELSEDTKFCSYCGEKVGELEDTGEPHLRDEFAVNKTNNRESLADKVRDKFMAFWRKLNMFEKICTIMLVVFVFFRRCCYGE